MQPLERAVAIFCIACICAELTTQLAGIARGWRAKAVAGDPQFRDGWQGRWRYPGVRF